MIDQNSILNDPNMVPFITHGGQCLKSHHPEGRILIVRSRLNNRTADATGSRGKHGTWMKVPNRQMPHRDPGF